jgi:hypothetical protein
LIGLGPDPVDGAGSGVGPLGRAEADVYCRVTYVELVWADGELERTGAVCETDDALVWRGRLGVVARRVGCRGFL